MTGLKSYLMAMKSLKKDLSVTMAKSTQQKLPCPSILSDWIAWRWNLKKERQKKFGVWRKLQASPGISWKGGCGVVVITTHWRCAFCATSGLNRVSKTELHHGRWDKLGVWCAWGWITPLLNERQKLVHARCRLWIWTMKMEETPSSWAAATRSACQGLNKRLQINQNWNCVEDGCLQHKGCTIVFQ